MVKRKHKYNARKVTHDGVTFASRDEGDYYLHLKGLQEKGAIKGFELQPTFELLPKFRKNGKLWRAMNYKADFKVFHNNGAVEVIDVKGYETTDFKLKQKLFEYKYPESLKVIARAPKYLAPSEWIELDELKKIRRERKKKK